MPGLSPRGLVMWGATGQARVLCELVMDQPYRPIAFIDRAAPRAPVAGAALLRDGTALEDWLRDQPDGAGFAGALAMGWVSDARLALGRTMQTMGIELVTLVHSQAWIARSADVGEGCQLLAGARVCAGARIGPHSILNTNASVDHEAVVGEGCHLTPGVVVAGEVTLGRNVFLGAGCVVLPRVTIGDGAMVGAGAVVTRDVAAGATVVGVPAAPLHRRGV